MVSDDPDAAASPAGGCMGAARSSGGPDDQGDELHPAVKTTAALSIPIVTREPSMGPWRNVEGITAEEGG